MKVVCWQLIYCTAYTYTWQKVGRTLPKNVPPTWMSRKLISVWNQPSKACLSLQNFFTVLLPYMTEQVIVCFIFEQILKPKSSLCLSSMLFLYQLFYSLSECYLYPQYLSERVSLMCRVVKQLPKQSAIILNTMLTPLEKKQYCSGCNYASRFTGLETAPGVFPSHF